MKIGRLSEQYLIEMRKRARYPKDFPPEDVIQLLNEIDHLRGIIKECSQIFGDSFIEWLEWRYQRKQEISKRKGEIKDLIGGVGNDLRTETRSDG